MYTDKALNCKDCGRDFTFSVSEQEFFAEKGFANEPVRCSECRSARKAQDNSSRREHNRSPRQMFSTACANCGKIARVPFQPTGDKPVYCEDCFQSHRQNNQ
ncbi:MAG: zinc-ribbon domain containing protein [Dethiobacteria bacterium]